MAKSTTDLNITCSQPGTAFAADITQALVAINSAHRSGTEPTYNIEDGVMWLDTSGADYKLKMRIGGVWKTLLDLNSGAFETVGELNIKQRLSSAEDRYNGGAVSSPNVSALKINGTTVTATPAELNYVDGVTSNIQTQLDNKPNTTYTHPITTGNKHVPSGGSTGQILGWSSDGTAVWATAGDGIPSGGSSGQILGWSSAGVAYWANAPSGTIPTGTSLGQVLEWGAGGTASWVDHTDYTHPTVAGYKHIPSGGSSGQYLKYSSSGTAVWATPSNGKILQVIQTHLTGTSSQSIVGGVRTKLTGLNATITPSSTSSRIRVTVRWSGERSNFNNVAYGIQRNSTDIGNAGAAGFRDVGISGGVGYTSSTSDQSFADYSYIDSPGSTSALEYAATALTDNNTTWYNQRSSGDVDQDFYLRLTSTIILEEISV